MDEFASRLSHFFGVHNDFFEEISKFRAARRMWARLMRDRYGATRPESMRMRFHTQTLGSTLVRQDPLNNILRGGLQALAAVLGGTQSLHVSGYDEAYDIPSEEAMRISLATQMILAHESGVVGHAGPAGRVRVPGDPDQRAGSGGDGVHRADRRDGQREHAGWDA